jgi:hypothetical protein
VFEVPREGRVVWEYRNAFEGEPLDMPGAPPRTALFRATRIAPSHPGLAGRSL